MKQVLPLKQQQLVRQQSFKFDNYLSDLRIRKKHRKSLK